MNKLLMVALLLMITVISSCSKNDVIVVLPPANTWTVGGSSYAATSCLYYVVGSTESGLAASNASGNLIRITFGTATVSAGQYRIVDGSPGASEALVEIFNGAQLESSSIGTDSAFATVAFDNAKLHVTIPNTFVQNFFGGNSRVTANLYQY